MMIKASQDVSMSMSHRVIALVVVPVPALSESEL